MKERTKQIVDKFFLNHQNLQNMKIEIMDICETLLLTYQKEGKVLICGNGGSCADGDHIVGELMKGFLLKRPLSESEQERFIEAYGESGRKIGSKLQEGLPAISLNVHSSLISAFENDVDHELEYAQQVRGYAKANDAVIGISTSGNSPDVVYALMTAEVLGCRTIALTGKDGGAAGKIAHNVFIAPSNETYEIQEYHIMVYHLACAYVESELFKY